MRVKWNRKSSPFHTLVITTQVSKHAGEWHGYSWEQNFLFICSLGEGLCIWLPMCLSLAGVVIFKESFLCISQSYPKHLGAQILLSGFGSITSGSFFAQDGELPEEHRGVLLGWQRLSKWKMTTGGYEMPNSAEGTDNDVWDSRRSVKVK